MGKHLLLLLFSVLSYHIALAEENLLEITNPPVVTISDPGVTIYGVGSGLRRVDGGITITDPDSQQAMKAEVVLSNRLDGAFTEELRLSPTGLSIITQNGLTLTIEPFPTMTLSITGEASFSVYQQILREVMYLNSHPEATPGDRLVTYTITDEDSNTSTPKSRIIRIEIPPVELEEVTTNIDGLYGIGDEILVKVKYSGPVFIGEGTPYIVINIGGKEVKAYLVSGSGTDQLVFRYVIEEGDLDLEGVEMANEITLGDAVMVDRYDREAPREFAIDQNILVDGVRPFITNITPPADGIYGACSEDQFTFELALSEEVSVNISNGSPTLQLIFNSGVVQANYNEAASTSTKLVFTYGIKMQDADLDGIVISRLLLNGSLIQDVAGNQFLDLDFQLTTLPDTEEIIIDTTPPAIPVITGISEDTGISAEDGFTSDQKIMILGSGLPGSSIKAYLDGVAIGETTVDEEGNWSIDHTAVTLAEGKYILTAKALNDSCVESELSAPFAVVVDITKPVVAVRNLSVFLDEEGTVTVRGSDADLGSTDNLTPADQLVFTLGKDIFTCEDLGDNTVEITVADLSGNSVTNTITITVMDEIAPILMAGSHTLYLGEDGTVHFTAEDLDTVVFDNCGINEFSIDKPLFSCSEIGDHTVVLQVKDKAGNAAEFTITVTVVDEMAPVLENAPENMVVGSNSSGEHVIPDFIAEMNITDNCAIASVEQFPATGSILSGFGLPHPIRITAIDIHGNETVHTFTITLVDRDISEILLPEIITVPWNTPLESVGIPATVVVILQNGEREELGVTWDIQNYNAMEPGLYQNEGYFSLPSDVFNPAGKEPSLTIIVEDKLLPIAIELDNQVFEMSIGTNAPIGKLSTIDPSDNIHAYNFAGHSADNSLFRIVDGVLFWNSTEYLPGRTEFVITVSSTDRMGNIIYETFTIERKLIALPDLKLTNVFTPNNDGINDTWGAESLAYYGKVRIMIYERSGKRVYYSTDPTQRWDGKYLGVDVAAGTYYYIIEVESTGEIHRSALTILRD